MDLQVVKHGSDAASKLSVSETLFDCDFNESLIHQVVTAYMAEGRQGSKAQKSRSDVSGGGAKPWKQKGTGRARAGTIRSPIWRKGGVTFAARPRDYSQKVNKRMYRKAMQSIISELVRQDRLVVVKELSVKEPKTKQLVEQLKQLELTKALIIVAAEDKNLQLSAKNIPHIKIVLADKIDPVSLVGAEKILITVDAIKKIEEKLS